MNRQRKITNNSLDNKKKKVENFRVAAVSHNAKAEKMLILKSDYFCETL